MRHAAVLGLLVALGSSSVHGTQDVANPKPTPAGTWHTIDDVSGKPRGIVVIHEVGGRFVGVLTGSFDPADSLSPICDRCSGDRKGKPVFGMEILRGLRPDGDSWSGGEILDPDTGKIYKAKAHLEDDGRKLVVRGYIGFALLGRSQVWLRAKEGQ
ncbi:MAG: hypothetical protein JWM41_785 [Gemmatimonadetes bacterium]|nr:hypothetical protein [Gemmatimonadota bacterium]